MFSVDIIANFIVKFLVVLLFIASYTYILKLEETGCRCSEHPYREFIKNFSLFGIVYLLVAMLITPQLVLKNMGAELASLYMLIDTIFLVVAVFYFYYAIVYVQYLVNEKCKCSADIRREILLYGSIIEFIIILQVLIMALFLPIIGGCGMTILSTVDKTKKGLSDAIHRPIDGVKKTPSNLKKIFSSTVDTTKRLLKKTGEKLLVSPRRR